MTPNNNIRPEWSRQTQNAAFKALHDYFMKDEIEVVEMFLSEGFLQGEAKINGMPFGFQLTELDALHVLDESGMEEIGHIYPPHQPGKLSGYKCQQLIWDHIEDDYQIRETTAAELVERHIKYNADEMALTIWKNFKDFCWIIEVERDSPLKEWIDMLAKDY